MLSNAEKILSIIDEYDNNNNDNLILNKLNKELFLLTGINTKLKDVKDLKLLLIKELAKKQIKEETLSKTFSKPKVNLIKTVEKFLIKNRENGIHEIFGKTYLHDNTFEFTDMHVAFKIPREKLEGINDRFVLTESEQKELKEQASNAFPDFKRIYPKELPLKAIVNIKDVKLVKKLNKKENGYVFFDVDFGTHKKKFNIKYVELLFKILNTNELAFYTSDNEYGTTGTSIDLNSWDCESKYSAVLACVKLI